jgi:hypothetical protein
MKNIVLFILFLFFPCIAYAQFYHWVENGTHHFSNYQDKPMQKGKNTSPDKVNSFSFRLQKTGIKLMGPELAPGKIFPSGETQKKAG